MSSEMSQVLISIFFTAIFFVLIWLVTRFYKPKSLEIEFTAPWKEAFLAIGCVLVIFLAVTVVFFFWSKSAGGAIGTPEQYDLLKALLEWGIYAMISFIPVLVIIKTRQQGFETVGITKKNLKLSIGVGLVLSLLFVSLSTTLERLPERLFTYNTFYAFIYYLAVGFGEELLFRGFLQLRCSIWLGETEGLVLASMIMAFIHLPQRIFVLGLDPLQALVSATLLMSFSLLMGFFMLRTQNISGPVVLHTIAGLVGIL